MKTDTLIVGSGCAGLYCALQLPSNQEILIITKKNCESSDSFLAQGGMCMMRGEEDYESYFEDTMRAGHYENDEKSVEIMIRSSEDVVNDLLSYDVDFQKEKDGSLAFTREGAHSQKRILYHEDTTGKEITGKLLAEAKRRDNITIMEYTTLVDIVEDNNVCYGAVICKQDGSVDTICAKNTVLATGGIGGIYSFSTNYKHLTGDAIAIAVKHQVELKDINYVQIHPTTLYTKNAMERSFLISESVRGEGAKLYNRKMEHFVDELLPRDVVTAAIHKEMEKESSEFVWEDLRTIPRDELYSHFPNIVEQCKKMGYNVAKECIPVVPAQHYFMGGIKVNYSSKTSMERLYAIGETACNGVHGKNRLASNSLLESLVFAKRAAKDMAISEIGEDSVGEALFQEVKLEDYRDAKVLELERMEVVRNTIAKANEASEKKQKIS